MTLRAGLVSWLAWALLFAACDDAETGATADAEPDASAADGPVPDGEDGGSEADASTSDCERFCLDYAPPCGGNPEQCESECVCWVERWRPSAVSSVMECLGEPGRCDIDDYSACLAAAAAEEPRPSGLAAYQEICESNSCPFDRDACDETFLRLYAEGTIDALDECLKYVCDSVSDCVDGVLYCR